MVERKTVIITGGAGALGTGVVRLFAESGANVVVADREQALEGWTSPAGVVPVATDALDPNSAARTVEQALERFDKLDGLLCLAGGFFGDTPVLETSPEAVRQQFELNLMTAYIAVHAALPPMIEGGGGSIVCVSSRPAERIVAGSMAYATSKLGVLKLVDLLAEEYRENDIRANAIMPSLIDTPANREAMPDADHSRWVKPEEIARVLRFLVSDDSRVISGAHIPVYGKA